MEFAAKELEGCAVFNLGTSKAGVEWNVYRETGESNEAFYDRIFRSCLSFKKHQ